MEIGLIPSEVDGQDFMMGTYQSSPPTFVSPKDETCVSNEIEPLERLLEPGEYFRIAYHVRFPDPGPYRFEYPRIHYRSGFKQFYEIARVELFGDVQDSREPVPFREIDAACADEGDLLPGNSLGK
jgi:hypothetical protein